MAANHGAALTKVVLSSPTDWEPWFTLLRDKATALEVWEFVDPEKDTPQPKRPQEPEVGDVKDGATHLKDLIIDNDRSYLDLYKLALSKWQHADRNYDRVLAALQDVAEYIRTTVATNWVLLIDDKVTLREKVKALKAQLAPTDYASKMLARERYRKAQNVDKSQVNTWIQNWERALKEAQKKNLGEVRDDLNATYDFLGAVESITPGFSDLWRDRISGWEKKGKTDKIPDGFKIAEHFRDFWRTRVATAASKDEDNSASFSAGQWTPTPRGNNTPTLQGKTPSGTDKKCVCGAAKTKEHNWKTCQYVRHEILGETYPYGSKVDESSVKRTRDSLKKDKFRKLVRKILTGDDGATSERGEGDSPNSFNYDDTEMPEHSGFNVAKQASPIVDCRQLF
jgi:hypothetical protein